MGISYAIEKTKRLIDDQINYSHNVINTMFRGYQNTYFITNEDIKAYLKLVSFEGKDSALSVLASGDQAFSLITEGITNIDTFDINSLSEYMALGLKRAMILKYSYEEFWDILNRVRSFNLNDLTDFLKDLLPFMEPKHQQFWKSIINYNYKLQVQSNRPFNLLLLLSRGGWILNEYWEKVNYLESKEKYETLRNRLGNTNISFRNASAYNLGKRFKGKEFDFILFSNILDYFTKYFGEDWDYSKLKAYEKTLMPLLKKDGVIFLHYLFTYFPDEEEQPPLFHYSEINKEDLEDEEFHILNTNGRHNSVLLKRAR